jgi:glutamyl-tRNA synthetase
MDFNFTDEQKQFADVLRRWAGKDYGFEQRRKIIHSPQGISEQAWKTLVELGRGAAFLLARRPLVCDEKASQLLNEESRSLLSRLVHRLEAGNDWEIAEIEATIRAFAEEENLKLGKVAQPLRAAVTGSTVSPPIFDVLVTLGREESIGRIKDQAA